MKDTLATAPILALDWKLPNLINKHLTPEQHRDIALRILIQNFPLRPKDFLILIHKKTPASACRILKAHMNGPGAKSFCQNGSLAHPLEREYVVLSIRCRAAGIKEAHLPPR